MAKRHQRHRSPEADSQFPEISLPDLSGVVLSPYADRLHDLPEVDQPLTLGAALDLYQEIVTPTKRGIREELATLGVIRLFGKSLLDVPLMDVAPRHIAAYRNARRNNPSIRRLRDRRIIRSNRPPSDTTIRKELCLISDIFRRAKLEWGLDEMPNPVVQGIRPRAAGGRVRRLSDAEKSLILVAAREYEQGQGAAVPIRTVIELALETAMRLGELASIQWQDINFEKRYVQLHRSKNGEPRAVPLSPRAVELLGALGRKASGPVFECASESIRTAWNRVVRRSKVRNFRFHDLRHEAISNLIENSDRYGLSLPEVMYVAGHKTLVMVARYYHALAPKIARKLER